MTIASARATSRTNRVSGMVMALVAMFTVFALIAPQADAARKSRIVAISPFAAQTMMQLGVRPMRVGQTLGATNRQNRMLRGIPKLALSHPNGPNLEVMARLRPRLVISSRRWNSGFRTLRRLGIRVVVADPTSPRGVFRNVRRIGRVIGRQRPARRLNRRIRRQIRRSTRGIRGSREKVLVVLGIGRTAMAFLHNSWGGRLVKLAGGRLVTGGATSRGGFARLSDEVVVAENPDRIIVVPHGSTQDLDQVVEYILNNEAWQTTDAYKNGNIQTSVDNTLLQAGTDVGRTIRRIRSRYLQNW